ncbi:hypothetical protein ACN09X_11600, partial [Aliarcobacter butzleri]|uniref:hypothetical protein n=1 Tax=Aliarcobacter butzleri TaxID=28197 RepID=UPI003AE60C4F
GTFFCAICKAKPSAIAVLPPPGSPASIGLFFFLLLNISITLEISLSLPTTGSISPFLAIVTNSLGFYT